MVVPKATDFYLSTLKGFEDSQIHRKKEIRDFNANYLNLSDEDKRERTRGGNIRYYSHSNRAIDDLFHAGLLRRLDGGQGYQITEEGLNVLSQDLDCIDLNFLYRYSSFCEFKGREYDESTRQESFNENQLNTNILSPIELLEGAYDEINNELSVNLLEKILENTPESFESLVLDLLINMGYGGSKQEAAIAVGRSGDGGIDGIIKEDYLGLDKVYIQAKRYANTTIGDGYIRDFIGALDSVNATKGVFITTSRFSSEAIERTKLSTKNIVLIDGEKLTRLMIKFNVGVSLSYNYEIKEIDNDYFDNL